MSLPLKATGTALLGIFTAFIVHFGIVYFTQNTEPENIHVHADFLFYINGEQVALTDDIYQSSANNLKHADIHFHDNNDDVIHRHAKGVTFGAFLDSLGFALTPLCLTNDSGTRYCTDDTHVMRLYVNGGVVGEPQDYVIEEGDQILLYYGDPEDPATIRYQDEITSDAYIYSGTCPERGVPPPESCGLTCEI